MMLDPRLEQWLDTATAGLSRDSKRRIRDEITEHYCSSREEGLDGDTALKRLGDPLSARQQLRKTYLTSMQEILVSDYRGTPPTWRLIAFVAIFLIGIGVALLVPETRLQRITGLAMVLVLSVALMNLCVLTPWLYRRGRERIAVFLGAFSDWALYVGLLGGSSIVIGDLTRGKVTFFLAVLGVLLVLYIPLLRKLHRRRPWTPHAR